METATTPSQGTIYVHFVYLSKGNAEQRKDPSLTVGYTEIIPDAGNRKGQKEQTARFDPTELANFPTTGLYKAEFEDSYTWDGQAQRKLKAAKLVKATTELLISK